MIFSDLVGIIADDLTGANDTALQFHIRGASTKILLDSDCIPKIKAGTEVWDKQAEFAGEYIKKGRQVVVDGRISISKWTDQTGEERERFLIVANNVRLLGSKRDAEQ